MPRSPWTGEKPIAFVDSNVVNELFTGYDLQRAVHARVETRELVDVEELRRHACAVFWMAMAFDAAAAVTLILEDEAIPFLKERIAHPGDSRGWLIVVNHFARTHIWPAWQMANLDATVAGRAANDSTIVKDATARGIPVISRDRGVHKKAAARGARAFYPEEWAAARISLQEARRRFFQRFDAHSMRWIFEHARASETETWEQSLRTQAWCLGRARSRFAYIWTDAPGDWEVSTPHGVASLADASPT